MTILEWKLLRWLATPSVTPGTWPSAYPSWNGRYFYPKSDRIVKAANAIALRWIESGWLILTAEFPNDYHLSREAIALSAATPEPTWTPPLPVLADFDWTVLRALEYQAKRGWASPMRCGGTNGSGHSRALAKLTHHGYAWRRGFCSRPNVTGADSIPKPNLFKRGKGSHYFKITEAGVAALRQRAALKKSSRRA
jgi:hypothetical protein